MRRPNRSRSADLDRLLDEDVADGTALAQVLAAARAPGAAEELVGLSTAMSAFATANRNLPRTPVGHRAARHRAITGRGLLAKTVAAVGGVTVAGSVAYAATTVGFTGIGGGSDHPPAFHSTSPAHQGDTDGINGSSPFGSTAPGEATETDRPTRAKTTPARTTGAPPSHAVENPASGKTQPDSTHPVHPTQSPHPTHPPSPTHPAPSSSATPPAHGRTSHPTHPPTPSHGPPTTHSSEPKA